MTDSKSIPFDLNHGRYDEWFERYQIVYFSELLAVRSVLPLHGLGIEIGVGTGRFAAPLGVHVGIDPSAPMLAYAAKRGVHCIQGAAEELPFKNMTFDYALIVTTICFVENPRTLLNEACRILKPAKPLIVAFIDRSSPLGQNYLAYQVENIFYRHAKFYSMEEIAELMCDTGFVRHTWRNTLSKAPELIKEIEPAYEGQGDGAFVVLRGFKAGKHNF